MITDETCCATETLSVSAIRNGTVIDHIPPGKGLMIVHALKLGKLDKHILIGLNLPSNTMERKDIIKIEDWEPEEELNPLALLAPQTSINRIKDYEVIHKSYARIPDSIEGSKLIKCPNPKCISALEPVRNRLTITKRQNSIKLRCYFCRKNFSLDDMDFNK